MSILQAVSATLRAVQLNIAFSLRMASSYLGGNSPSPTRIITYEGDLDSAARDLFYEAARQSIDLSRPAYISHMVGSIDFVVFSYSVVYQPTELKR